VSVGVCVRAVILWGVSVCAREVCVSVVVVYSSRGVSVVFVGWMCVGVLCVVCV